MRTRDIIGSILAASDTEPRNRMRAPAPLLLTMLLSVIACCSTCEAQEVSDLPDMVYYQAPRDNYHVDPEKKHFHFVLDSFQPINMEATDLRPFDSMDHSTLIPEHRDDPTLSKLQGAMVHFDAWNCSVGEDQASLLRHLSQALRSRPEIALRIEAHTDNIGDPVTNMVLSRHRAEYLKAVLLNLGVEEARIFAVGYGDRFPIASNSERAGRMTNRRAEFRLLLIDR